MAKASENPFQNTQKTAAAPFMLNSPEYKTVALLRIAGQQSRSSIAEHIGYSPAKITGVVNKLVEKEILHEVGDSEYTGGRRSRSMGFNPDFGYLVTAMIEKDRLDIALVDFDEGVRIRRMLPIDVQQGPIDIVDKICHFALERLKRLDIPLERVFGVGVTVPSAVHLDTGTLFDSPDMPGWGGYQIESHLKETFPYAQVVIERDCNVMAFGEFRKGIAQEHHHLIYVKVESSISIGLILDGKIYRGANGRAGEIRFVQSSGDESMEQYVKRVGKQLALLVNLLDPEMILLGGDSHTVGPEYLAAIRRSILEHSLSSTTQHLKIEIAPLGIEANMTGIFALTAESIFMPND